MHELPRDLVTILRTEAQNQRTPPIDYVVAEDGGRMVHRPEPNIAMAELLEEAAEALSRTGAVKVKPLEWEDRPAGGWQALAAGMALYSVHPNGDSWYLGHEYMGEGGKAAAQADCERRILSALEATLAPMVTRPTHCGGCGETDPAKRCIGCLADFGPAAHQQQETADADHSQD